VGVAREAVEEAPQVLVQERVDPDLVVEGGELGRVRQVPVDQEEGRLEERGLPRQLVDRVAPVAQDAGVAIDVRDGRGARGGVDIARVVGDVSRLRQQFAHSDPGGPFRRRLYRQ
jgi:hypothetical protein